MRVVTRSDFKEIVAHLSIASVKAVDTETTGLSEQDQLFSVIVTDAEESYYFNFNENADHLGNRPPLEMVLPRHYLLDMAPIFDNPDSLFYLQNAKFDMRMLAKQGIRIVAPIYDTEVMGRLERNTHLAYNLDVQAKRFLDIEKDDAVKNYVKKHKLYTKVSIPGKGKQGELQHYDRVPFEIMSRYGAQDGRVTYALGNALIEKLRQDGGMDEVFANESRLTQTCFRMERVGIKVDLEYTRRALNHEMGLLNTAKEAFRSLCGEQFDNSKAQLLRVFTAAGERIPKTSKGNDSLTDEILDTFRTPIARAVQQIRTHEKLIGTYYSSFIYLATSEGLIHADIRQAGTATGRFSYREPNLQNLPKEDEEPDINRPYPVRGCFVPRPGFCFVMIDYSQQEYRMMLDYAKQKDLIASVMSGVDVHQATADLVGITRKQAKTLNFAILYGAGAAKLADMLGLSRLEANRLLSKYNANLPQVVAFKEKVMLVGKQRGYIRNWLGRRCYVETGLGYDTSYKLPNHLIQGSCADVVKVAMNRLDSFLLEKKSRMVAQVHDEILFEVHETELHLVPELKTIMENVYPSKNGITLEASVEHSWKSWAARDKVKGFPDARLTG